MLDKKQIQAILFQYKMGHEAEERTQYQQRIWLRNC